MRAIQETEQKPEPGKTDVPTVIKVGSEVVRSLGKWNFKELKLEPGWFTPKKPIVNEN